MRRLSYNELILLPTFEERVQYLRQNGLPSEVTFGGHRLLNQMLYHSYEWNKIRQEVIIRDNGCDLGILDRPIQRHIIIHHINPITIEEVETNSPEIFSMNNLICCSHLTHNTIHYGDGSRLTPSKPIERFPNDQTPWIR